MSQSKLSESLRRSLLIKIISRKDFKPSDIDAVIKMASMQIVDLMDAQSMTFYLVVGNQITFKYIYYSPTLYLDNPDEKAKLDKKKAELLALELPRGTGIVGRVIDTEEPIRFSAAKDQGSELASLLKDTGFDIEAMLSLPLVGNRCVGAIQLINKEPGNPERDFSDEDLQTLKEVAEYTAPLIQKLVDPEYEMSDEAVAKYTAEFTGDQLVTSADEIGIEEKLIEIVGDKIIQQTGIFPVANLAPNSISALMENPYDYPNKDSFEDASNLKINEVMVAPANLIRSLMKQYLTESNAMDELPEAGADISGLVDVIGEEYGKSIDDADSDNIEESAPIISLANRIIEDAYVQGASDIHIEPQENDLLVRYRIDGVCKEKLRLPQNVSTAIVARLKIMAQLDIAEKRLPQDGRIVFKKYSKRKIDIDLRLATGPMNFGEKIVMRILDKSKSALPITALGFSEDNLEKYQETIKQPYGMILHCGPTGSGKSMTLFSALREIAKPDLNIQTAEDPIEYTIPGINQMQMKKSIGLDFARALRAYLRMDPDIILVGEIRDKETAHIAIEAALTGHLLLSTLHTNDAPSTVARLTDMDIEPFMISASLLVVCAQRLMRRVCPTCRLTYKPEGSERDILERALGSAVLDQEIFRASANGCPKCNNIGMKGRVGIHELMTNSSALTQGINTGADTAALKKIAMGAGMKTLHQDALLKVTQGISTIMEAVSTVPADTL